jgi:hypothetical protein
MVGDGRLLDRVAPHVRRVVGGLADGLVDGRALERALLSGLLLEVGVSGADGGDADGLVLGDDLSARVRDGRVGGAQIGTLLVDDDVFVGAIASGGRAAGDAGTPVTPAVTTAAMRILEAFIGLP